MLPHLIKTVPFAWLALTACCQPPLTADVVGSQQVSDDISVQLAAASDTVKSKDFELANVLYKKLIDSSTDESLRAIAIYRSAEAKYLSGDLTEAAVALRKFLDERPQHEFSAAAYNLLAEIALRQGNFEQAISIYNSVLGEVTEDHAKVSAQLGLARALLAAERWSEVPIAVGRLTSHDDADVASEAILFVGRSKYESRQFAEALATFRRVYDLPTKAGNQHRARLAAGWALWMLSEFEQCSLEIQPLSTILDCAIEYRYLSGMSAYGAKNWSVAIKDLTKCSREKNHHRAPALYYLAECLKADGQLQDARSTYEELIATERKSEWSDDAALGLAQLAYITKNYEEWKIASRRLRQDFPDSDLVSQLGAWELISTNKSKISDASVTLFEKAVCHERDGHYDAALSLYQKLLNESSEELHDKCLWHVGRLYDQLDQPDKASKYYRELLQTYPDFESAPQAMAFLGKAEAATGNHAIAQELHQQLVEKFPESSHAIDAAYWLAIKAAEARKYGESQQYVNWLLKSKVLGSQVVQGTRLREQVYCLQCQLFAERNEWKSIVELLGSMNLQTANGPSTARLAYWQAEANFRLGKYERASECFDAMLPKTIGVFESWVPMVALRRAQLAANQEDWASVQKIVNELGESCAEFELIYECDYLRGRALAGQGQMTAARTAYSDVLNNDWATGTETAAMAQWMIGETYFHQQNYLLAIAAYEKVMQRHQFPEWQSRAALQAGKCAELEENWSKASDIYAIAVSRWKDTGSQTQLKARIKWVEQRVAQQNDSLRR